MNTDRNATGIPELLRQIYAQAYVEFVIKNPLMQPGSKLNSELFEKKLQDLVQSHSAFS